MNVVAVRNQVAGPVVFSDEGPPRSEFQWEGKGDPQGRDLKEVPELLTTTVSFRRALARGIVSIEQDASESAAIMERQVQAWRNVQPASTVDDALQRVNNDYVSLPCIGPNNRGNGNCGADVTIKDTEKDGKVPLCGTHEGLAPQFIRTEIIVDGQLAKSWVRQERLGHSNPA